MSIIGFHRLLITIAILFCAGFAVRESVRWAAGAGGLALLLAGGFALAAAGLGYYLAHLSRFLQGKRST
ncbi:MAG: hypothetical protein ACE5HQ_01485 [Gemmatimonadota bacterium]